MYREHGGERREAKGEASGRPFPRISGYNLPMFWTPIGDAKGFSGGGVVMPEERLSWPRTVGIGLQHVVAMFGATVPSTSIHAFRNLKLLKFVWNLYNRHSTLPVQASTSKFCS